MTNTKMLEVTYAIIKGLESDQQTMIDSLIKTGADFSKTIGGVEPLLATLVLNLKDDIVAEEAKKNGKTNQLKAIKAILKSGSKLTYEALHYAKTIDGMQYICDGHILAKIKPIDTLPECPGTLQYLNVLDFFDKHTTHDNQIIVPDNAKLKAYIKDQKLKHKSEREYKIFYNFGKDQPLVDAELLSLAIDIMNGNFNCYCKNEKSALYFSDENNNEVMLMPMGSKSKNDVTTEL